MAEEKPFDPTPSKLAKARRDGDLPRSADVNAVASFACASLGLVAVLGFAAAAAGKTLASAAVGDRIGRSVETIARDRAATIAVDPLAAVVARIDAGAYGTLALAACVVIGCALVGAIGATFAQTRTLTVKFPAPKFEKLDPFAGLRRMVSRDAAVGGAKALVVTCAIAAAVVPVARDVFAAVSGSAGGVELASLVARALRAIFASAIAVAAPFAIVDLLLERAKWRTRLKMTFDELKRDSKQNDGDPHVRSRRRQSHRALVRGSIGRVRDAAFVITNPTHVAIALEYRPPEVPVPRVLVRAIDAGAREVKKRARELRVPIVENVALARALLASTDVGDVIPPDAYAPVAAIVAMLARMETVA